MTSGHKTEWVYSYNPGAHTGHKDDGGGKQQHGHHMKTDQNVCSIHFYESPVTWATSVPILVFFLGLCSRLRPDVIDRRQT